MDDNQTFSDSPVAETPTRSKRTIALAASALILCTAGGAVGGLAIGSTIHGSTSGTNNASSSLGNGYAIPVLPGDGTFGRYGHTFQFPGGGLGTQQSGNTETTSTPTSSQLVGLVRIQSTLSYQNGAAVGTGMILSGNGVVVTNHHVVAGATKVVVTVESTGQTFPATLVGSDASEDIAVLQLQGASGLSTIQTNSSAVAVGQKVTAVGDAQGASSFTASPGKVIALNQTISPSDGSNNETITGVIQFAADVMSGDSGGATYDSSGKVVGMTTAASTGGAQTNGYAIPIAKVLSVAADLQRHASNSRYTYGATPFIGIGVNQNAVVEQIYPGTGAARSGLTAGDRIIALDGTSVTTSHELQTATRKYRVGQTIKLTWTTASGRTQSASIRLIAGPAA